MRIGELQGTRGSYFDPEFGTIAVRIAAGEFFATASEVGISTLLGSCVSVCLYDRDSGIGGMNHFMLPELLRGDDPTPCPGQCNTSSRCCARYGGCAMRQMMQQLQRLGADPGRLEAKLFGGARVMASTADIGGDNAAFAVEYLKKQGIPITASDLGACCPRKVMFFPATGRAWVKRMRDLPLGKTCRSRFSS